MGYLTRYFDSLGLKPEGRAGVLGNLIGGGVDLVNGFLNRRFQERMIDKQNEYNLPINSLKRYMDAGMNPNLAMQKIDGGNMAQGDYASLPNAMPEGLGQYMQDAGSKIIEAKMAESNIKKNAADVKVQELVAAGKEIENKVLAKELGGWDEYRKSELDKMNAEADNAKQAKVESEERVKEIKQQVENLKEQKELIKAERGAIYYDNMLKQKETELAQANKELAEANKEYTEAKKKTEELMQDPEKRKEFSKAEREAEVETNPISKQQKAIVDEYNDEVGKLNADIRDLREEVWLYEHGKKEDNYFKTGLSVAKGKLHKKEGEKQNIEDKYFERLRRIGLNESESYSALGISGSRSK